MGAHSVVLIEKSIGEMVFYPKQVMIRWNFKL